MFAKCIIRNGFLKCFFSVRMYFLRNIQRGKFPPESFAIVCGFLRVTQVLAL